MIILQKTIAERAGVSYATVSRAFTNSAKVKPQTMQKIRNAMQELGITDGDDMLLGKGFVSKAVLVIVSDISNYFYSKVVKGICEGLDPLGYTVVLCHCGLDANRELAAMRRAMENGYSGIIMITVTATEEIIQLLQSSSIPIVLVNRYISALDLDTVRIDNYRGGYMAAQYLWERGHRHIAMLTGVKGSGTASDRCRGFSEGLQNYACPFPAWIWYTVTTPGRADENLPTGCWLKKNPAPLYLWATTIWPQEWCAVCGTRDGECPRITAFCALMTLIW